MGLRSHPFSLLDEEIVRIRAAFQKAGFDEANVTGTLGVKSVSAIKDISAEAAYARTQLETPLNTLIRLFVIGAPAPSAAIAKAFSNLTHERLIAGGLLQEKDNEAFAAVKITPIGNLLIAFDRSWKNDFAEVADHVMGPSDSASLLAGLIIRTKIESVLDVGSGCGYLAFLAARTSARVVATDLNPRASAFVSFNAKLNDIKNVEARTGDLFAPVAGERFDLVISNPPFVISPEERLIYLNGGMKADAFCQRMAAEAPLYLNEGGYFQMLCNWVENANGAWQDRLQTWFLDSGCNTWVIRSSSTEALAYAQAWMKTGRNGVGEDDPKRLEAWLAYYRAEKITAIGSGVVIMRKASASETWFRAFDAPEKIAGQCGEVVRERLESLQFMAIHGKDDESILTSVFQVTDKVRLTQECIPSSEGWSLQKATIRIAEGFVYTEEIDMWVAELLAACDGKRTLMEAIDRTLEVMGQNEEDVPEETIELVRQLVDEGFLIPSPL